MIVKCSNCGKEMLTEADTFIYQHRYNADYYSCGCAEGIIFNKPKAFSDGWLKRQVNLASKTISEWTDTKKEAMGIEK